jgi:periplasmic copper chaperone A
VKSLGKTFVRRSFLLGAAASFGVCVVPHRLAADHVQSADELRIEHAWARATLGNARTGAVYLRIVNAGSTDDRLLAAYAEIAGRSELHDIIREGTVLRMRHLTDGVKIRRGEFVDLSPGGRHVMLVDIKEGLVEGQRFALRLVFERRGHIDIDVAIEGLRWRQAPSQDGNAPHLHPEDARR